MALSHKAVLRVLLAVWCCSCRYGIVCPSYGLYGSIFIYYKAGLCVSGCMRTYAYNLTLQEINRRRCWNGNNKKQKRPVGKKYHDVRSYLENCLVFN